MDTMLTLRQYAVALGATYGTVKRWRHEGMPAVKMGSVVRVRKSDADAWVAKKRMFEVTIGRESVVYFARREDGAIKIGFSSDTDRRMRELKKDTRQRVVLLATIPGTKLLEMALQSKFSHARFEDEWFRPVAGLTALVECLAHG